MYVGHCQIICTAQVDQYHEEAGGQRTVVRLGEFSSTSKSSPNNSIFLVDFIACTDLFLHTLQTNIVSFSGLEEVFMCLEIEMFCFFTETNATVVRTICYYRIDATHTTFQVNTTRATQSNHGT